MGRTMREVEIYTRQFEGWWYADVDRRPGETLFSTTWFRTKDRAVDAAEAWIKANGLVTMPF